MCIDYFADQLIVMVVLQISGQLVLLMSFGIVIVQIFRIELIFVWVI
jgi:hypothetical protein